VPGENNLTLGEALNDTFRVNYFAQYLSNLSAAIYLDNVNIVGTLFLSTSFVLFAVIF
jgi:hypothetical protein